MSIHYRHRVLLVGGQADFIARKVIPRLATLNAPDGAPVSVPRHVPWKTDRFPSNFVGMDSVMVVTDMVSHTLANAARDHAKRCAVPYIPISRKWLESAASLVRYGYRVPPPEASTPPAAAPVEAATPIPAPEVSEMPRTQPRTTPRVSRKDALQKAIETLAADPSTTNASLIAAHGESIRTVLADARRRLGIVAPRHGGSRTVSLVPVTFVATCAEFGIPDAVACESLARFPHVGDAPKEAPVPVPAPAPPTPLDTLREAVALLRVAMTEANIVSLSIDSNGNVKAERVTITTVRW